MEESCSYSGRYRLWEFTAHEESCLLADTSWEHGIRLVLINRKTLGELFVLSVLPEAIFLMVAVTLAGHTWARSMAY